MMETILTILTLGNYKNTKRISVLEDEIKVLKEKCKDFENILYLDMKKDIEEIKMKISILEELKTDIKILINDRR